MYKTISDIISVDDIQTWTPEKLIFILASTGRGKSHFIKNKLHDYALARGERILLILHRKNCHHQFKEELIDEHKTETITTVTYQTIEQRVMDEAGFDFSPYTYIVCDECHYFLEDSDFNPYTDMSFRAILEAKKITLMLSATGVDTKEYIASAYHLPCVEYELLVEDMHIRHLNFFKDMESTPLRVAQRVIQSGEKAIFFIQSAQKAWDLKRQLGNDAIFNCSQYNKSWARHVDPDVIASVLEAESFDVPIFITTACFDAGINIKDKTVKTILVDITNLASAIQCIGRRRIDHEDSNDRIDVYVHIPSGRTLNGIILGKSNNLKIADYLIENGSRAFIQRYHRNTYSNMIYDNPHFTSADDMKCVNALKYHKDMLDIRRFKGIMSEESGYQHRIAESLHCIDPETGEYIYNEVDSNDILSELLDSFCGRTLLTPREREPLIQALSVQSDGKTLRRVASLNEALERRKFPYQIVSFRTSRMENGRKIDYYGAWRVERRTE